MRRDGTTFPLVSFRIDTMLRGSRSVRCKPDGFLLLLLEDAIGVSEFRANGPDLQEETHWRFIEPFPREYNTWGRK